MSEIICVVRQKAIGNRQKGFRECGCTELFSPNQIRVLYLQQIFRRSTAMLRPYSVIGYLKIAAILKINFYYLNKYFK